MGVQAFMGAAGLMQGRSARKQAQRAAEQQKADAQLAADTAKEEREKALASKPTGSMGTTARIASEKAMLKRRAGRGRASTVLDENYKLG